MRETSNHLKSLLTVRKRSTTKIINFGSNIYRTCTHLTISHTAAKPTVLKNAANLHLKCNVGYSFEYLQQCQLCSVHSNGKTNNKPHTSSFGTSYRHSTRLDVMHRTPIFLFRNAMFPSLLTTVKVSTVS